MIGGLWKPCPKEIIPSEVAGVKSVEFLACCVLLNQKIKRIGNEVVHVFNFSIHDVI